MGEWERTLFYTSDTRMVSSCLAGGTARMELADGTAGTAQRDKESVVPEGICYSQHSYLSCWEVRNGRGGSFWGEDQASQAAEAPLLAQSVNNLPAAQQTWVQCLGWGDPLEEGMATHSSILPGESPWTEEPGGLQSMRSQRVGHDWATKHIHQLVSKYFNNFTIDQIAASTEYQSWLR